MQFQSNAETKLLEMGNGRFCQSNGNIKTPLVRIFYGTCSTRFIVYFWIAASGS